MIVKSSLKPSFEALVLSDMMIVVQGFLTAKKYTYSIVGSEDLEKANSLLYDTYHPDEPLNRCSMSRVCYIELW